MSAGTNGSTSTPAEGDRCLTSAMTRMGSGGRRGSAALWRRRRAAARLRVGGASRQAAEVGPARGEGGDLAAFDGQDFVEDVGHRSFSERV